MAFYKHPLARYVLRRLGIGVILVLGVTVITFTLTRLVPGDPIAANLSDAAMADPEIVASFRAEHGLDQPVPVQYLKYLSNLLQGDLGTSMQSGRPVMQDLREFFPATLELTVLAMILAVTVGVSLGIVAAVKRNSWIDQVIRVVSLGGASMPIFWLALLAFYVFYYQLGWLPGTSRLSPGTSPPVFVTGTYVVDGLLAGDFRLVLDAVHHLILPAGVIAAYAVGVFARFSRAATLEALSQEYVEYARAKGLSEWKVITTYALLPALLSILTLLGISFASMLAGTVLVEQIFSWPGIGRYAYTSALDLDLPSIMGVTVLVAMVFIVTNLAVDILVGFIDPQVRVV
jgi:peptide/nickel transport system permease protein